MKTSSLFLGLILSCTFLLTNCSKDDSNPTPAATDFSPTTTGSNWTYKYTEGQTADTFKLTATANSKDFNTKSYKIFTTDAGDTTYMGKKDGNYYRFQSFPQLGIENYEELYLKDNAKVNDTWSGTANIVLSGQAISVNFVYTVTAIGETHSTLGKSYNDVTHVKLTFTVFSLPIGGGEFYYAKGIGMVDAMITANDPTSGQTYTSTQQLLSYEIK